MATANYEVHEVQGFQYVDEGTPSDVPPVVLLHGMLGDLSNWTDTISALADHRYRVLVPVLPVYNLPLKKTNVQGLVQHVHNFLRILDIDSVVLIGNSLGGHVALFCALDYPEAVSALILTGSSGIYEVEMGTSTMRRRDRDFIRERAAMTFYDPAHATDELVDEMFELVNDRTRALRLIKMARSAQSETVTDQLAAISAPTLLVWGANDTITPPDVARQFRERLPHAELSFIDECGHAPMIEHPQEFNNITLDFLRRTIGTPAWASPQKVS